MKQFNNGDRNTKFFHSYVTERRKKLNIPEIYTAQGDLINSIENNGEEAVSYFEDQFKEEDRQGDCVPLNIIPQLITEDQNERMVNIPT